MENENEKVKELIDNLSVEQLVELETQVDDLLVNIDEAIEECNEALNS